MEETVLLVLSSVPCPLLCEFGVSGMLLRGFIVADSPITGQKAPLVFRSFTGQPEIRGTDSVQSWLAFPAFEGKRCCMKQPECGGAM